MRFINDRQLADMPALAGLPADERARALEDAATIYRIVDQNPFVKGTRLVTLAEAEGLTPARVNAAVQVLKSTERLIEMPDAVAANLTPEGPSIP